MTIKFTCQLSTQEHNWLHRVLRDLREQYIWLVITIKLLQQWLMKVCDRLAEGMLNLLQDLIIDLISCHLWMIHQLIITINQWDLIKILIKLSRYQITIWNYLEILTKYIKLHYKIDHLSNKTIRELCLLRKIIP